MLKTPLKFIITIILTLGLSMSFQSLLASWTAPTAPPPTPNVPAPINTGTLEQTKGGLLNLGNGLTILGDTITNGDLWFDGGAGGIRYIGTTDSNQLRFRTHNLDRLTIRGGNIGIGTTNPLVQLHVLGTAHMNSLMVGKIVPSQTAVLDVFNPAPMDNIVKLRNNADTEVMVVKNSGNVGIGTTNPTDAKLHVNGTIRASTPTEDYHVATKDYVDDKTSSSGVPAGAVMYFAMNSCPVGWLKANGATISRSTYSNLFASIGTTFGSGNGSTTFRLPDLRGEFMRGWDDGRGVDSSRIFGSAQLDQMQLITGSFGSANIRVGSQFVSGAFTSHAAYGARGRDGTAQGRRFTFSSSGSPNARTSATTDGETRSRNVALLACIQF